MINLFPWFSIRIARRTICNTSFASLNELDKWKICCKNSSPELVKNIEFLGNKTKLHNTLPLITFEGKWNVVKRILDSTLLTNFFIATQDF